MFDTNPLNKNSNFKKYDLNNKIDDFIKKYSEHLKNIRKYTDIGNFFFPRDLRNFIEAKAVYSELIYPKVYGLRTAGNDFIKDEKFNWGEFKKVFSFKSNSIQNDEFFNKNVLYRVIERGGNRVGGRRGVLFAEEFNLDLTLPVAYSIDWSDPHLYDFIKPLIPKLNLDFICPVGYFSRSSENLNNIEELTLEDVILRLERNKIRRERHLPEKGFVKI